MLKARNRASHLPGIVVMHGHSGFGKSTAASWVTVEENGVYVEVRSVWTTRHFLEQIVRMLGFEPERTQARLLDQVVAGLTDNKRPLIIDEADFILKKSYIEVVRDIYEMARVPVMLIGEEHLPSALRKWERFHNRILALAHARAATVEDGLTLRKYYCKRVDIADDLVAHIVRETGGGIRRIVTNLAEVEDAALNDGRSSMDLATWGDRRIFTGSPDYTKGA